MKSIRLVGGIATILAVDDNHNVRKLIRDTLEPLGYKVLTATNGKEAILLSRTSEEKIDLLLTDIVMPEMNGRQLFGKLQQESPDLKVILMSGYPADIVSPMDLLETGLVFISKPFAPTLLRDTIKRVLEGSAAD